MKMKRILVVAAAAAIQACAGDGSSMQTRLDAVRGDSVKLLQFLQDMPKGGDLHNHLSGAVAPESTLRWAAEDHFCVDTATFTLFAPPCKAMLASGVLMDPALNKRAIAAWSMQDWRPGTESGADHFFATFLKVGPVEAVRLGDMLAEVVSRAALDHVTYIELMLAPDFHRIAPIGARTGWNADFDVMRRRVESAGLADTLRAASRHLDSAEARAKAVMHCGTPAAGAGCNVVVRYVYYAIRAFPPEQTFAQILAGFEWPAIDPRFVALNLVAPEHNAVAVRDFALHMSMIDHLHAAFPNVAITLHAGELSAAVTGKETMRSHIRQSVETGHARRIGHGVDVMQEDNADSLFKELHDRGVLVEICLTSNDVILGVTGARHPLAAYLIHGVPVALGTDDEGVSRSDMTHEYMRAVRDQHLDYFTLKTMARNSLTYSFADSATKQRLLAKYDADVAAFEGKR